MENHPPDENLFDVQTHASDPTGRLPLGPDFLTEAPSGHILGWTQDAAMGGIPPTLNATPARRLEVVVSSSEPRDQSGCGGGRWDSPSRILRWRYRVK